MKKIYKELILNGLRTLSDVNKQEELWLSDGINSEKVSSFSECLEEIFTDSGLECYLEKEKSNLENIDLYHKINILKKYLEILDCEVHPKLLINDPTMIDIRKLSKEILVEFEVSEGLNII